MDSLVLFYKLNTNRKCESKLCDAYCFSQHFSRVATSFKQHETGFNSKDPREVTLLKGQVSSV